MEGAGTFYLSQKIPINNKTVKMVRKFQLNLKKPVTTSIDIDYHGRREWTPYQERHASTSRTSHKCCEGAWASQRFFTSEVPSGLWVQVSLGNQGVFWLFCQALQILVPLWYPLHRLTLSSQQSYEVGTIIVSILEL